MVKVCLCSNERKLKTLSNTSKARYLQISDCRHVLCHTAFVSNLHRHQLKIGLLGRNSLSPVNRSFLGGWSLLPKMHWLCSQRKRSTSSNLFHQHRGLFFFWAAALLCCRCWQMDSTSVRGWYSGSIEHPTGTQTCRKRNNIRTRLS